MTAYEQTVILRKLESYHRLYICGSSLVFLYWELRGATLYVSFSIPEIGFSISDISVAELKMEDYNGDTEEVLTIDALEFLIRALKDFRYD